MEAGNEAKVRRAGEDIELIHKKDEKLSESGLTKYCRKKESERELSRKERDAARKQVGWEARGLCERLRARSLSGLLDMVLCMYPPKVPSIQVPLPFAWDMETVSP